MDRRILLQGGLATASLVMAGRARAAVPPAQLIPIRVDPPEVFRTTVCTRPFREAGPRIEVETVGRKIVVRNYGHGGSGWSLSWGSAGEAVSLAMQSSPRNVAVIGAGALGLTAAITAQRAGANVTIYTRERFPFVRSARATGSWTPDSRIAKAAAVTPGFGDLWERMARRALAMHESYISVAGNPVEWLDNYAVHDPPPPPGTPQPPDEDTGFLYLQDRIRDLEPRYSDVPNDRHPFNSEHVRMGAQLTFNVAAYSHQLEQDFLIAGGRFAHADFRSPADFAHLKEHVVICCTGYDSRALWKDDTIIPVRGQIVWLTPQEGVHYGVSKGSLLVLARRDGIVVQETGPNETYGMGDDSEAVDEDAKQAALDKLKTIYRT